jgi:hypothetical protein
MTRANVVLPEPDSPSSATVRPRGTAMLTSFNTMSPPP